jgi:hypothetical protein
MLTILFYIFGAAVNEPAVSFLINHFFYACVSYHAAAQEARLAACQTSVSVYAKNVNRCVLHFFGVAVYQRVLLGVDCLAEFVPFAAWHMKPLAFAKFRIRAIYLAARRAVAARADDYAVIDDYRAITPP